MHSAAPRALVRWKHLLVSAVVVAAILVPPMSAQATFEGTNGKIFFEQGKNIYSANPDGSQRAVVVKSRDFPGKPKLREPAVSPNGQRIAFSTSGAIYVGKLGGRAKEITEKPADNLTLTALRTPAWSPNGQKIVFHAVRKQNGIFYARLYSINADGTGIKQIIRFNQGHFSQYSEAHPDWSLNNQIVYSALDDLWLINPNGSGKTNLTNDQNNYEEPSWSPSGDAIAVRHETEPGDIFSRPGIAKIHPQTGEPTDVTGNANDSSLYESPSYSPDGTSIVFSGFTEGSGFTQDLYVVNAAGGAPVDLNVSTDDKDALNPSWGPAIP